MQNLSIKEVIAEGFGSIGSSLSFNLDVNGIYLIKGRNGAGKTSIFNALCWVLYGVSLKGVIGTNVQTWHKYRPSTFRGTRVLVYFSVQGQKYCIARHIKFKGETHGVVGGSELMIFACDDGVWTLTSDLGKKDTQYEIDRLLGMDYKIFVNSVLFGQRMTRLISSSGQAKRELFEDIFETNFIQDAKDRASVKRTEVQAKLSEYTTIISTLESQHKIYSKQLEDSEKMLNEFEFKKQESIQRTKEELKLKSIDILSLKDTLIDLNEDKLVLKEKAEKLEKDLECFDNTGIVEIRKEQEKIKVTLRDLDGQLSEAKAEFNANKKGLSVASDNHIETKTKESSIIRNFDKKLADLESQKATTKTTCQACGKPIDADKLQSVLDGFDKSIADLKEQFKIAKNSNSEDAAKYLLQIDNFEKLLPNLTAKVSKIELERQAELDKLSELNKQEALQAKGYSSLESDLKVAKSAIMSNQKDIDNTEKLLKNLENGVASIEQHLEDLKATTPPTIDLGNLRDTLQEISLQIELAKVSFNKEQDYLEKVDFWVKKGFGAGGLSSYIFGVMLEHLNSRTKVYSDMIGISIEMGIDLTLASKPFFTNVLVDGTVSDYKELSGGEQQLVDICIAFAVHDLISKRLPILILDEVFEGLDPANINKVFDFVRNKVQDGKTVFIITHLPELDFTYCKTIDVDKVGNNTVIQWE